MYKPKHKYKYKYTSNSKCKSTYKSKLPSYIHGRFAQAAAVESEYANDDHKSDLRS